MATLLQPFGYFVFVFVSVSLTWSLFFGPLGTSSLSSSPSSLTWSLFFGFFFFWAHELLFLGKNGCIHLNTVLTREVQPRVLDATFVPVSNSITFSGSSVLFEMSSRYPSPNASGAIMR